jgi:hypothetical protein
MRGQSSRPTHSLVIVGGLPSLSPDSVVRCHIEEHFDSTDQRLRGIVEGFETSVGGVYSSPTIGAGPERVVGPTLVGAGRTPGLLSFDHPTTKVDDPVGL